MQSGDIQKVFDNRKVGINSTGLCNIADQFAYFRRRLTRQRYRSFARMYQAAERFEQSRLTGAVWPHQAKDLALPDREVDPVKSLNPNLL
jgi:hypothetical protein